MENAAGCPKKGLPGKDPKLPEPVDGPTDTEPCSEEQTAIKGCH